MPLTLFRLAERYAVARLAPDAQIPAWATGELVSITRTEDELSILAPAAPIPDDVLAERDWRLFGVRGPLPFSMTGVLAELSSRLADAGISIFAVSTYDTDYIATKHDDFERALAVLEAAGHEVYGRTSDRS